MVKVLVTGGCGFIGRHLVAALVTRGDHVRVLDIGHSDRGIAGVEYVRSSITDRDVLDSALERVECIYHLAAIAHLWRRNKEDFDRVNRVGTEILLQAAAAKRISRVVHCSTESILLPKRRNGAVIDESANLTLGDMAGPYTRSKFLAEQAAFSAARAGLHVVVVNPTVPIGDGDPNKTPPTAMLSLFLSGSSPFFLDCVLNLVDVRDLADGIVQAGERGRAGERYILGGENVTMRELLPRIEQKSGHRMPKHAVPVALAKATGHVAGWAADRLTHRPPVVTREAVELALRSAPFDSTKAKRELGYAPRPVDQALTEAIAAFKRGGDSRRV